MLVCQCIFHIFEKLFHTGDIKSLTCADINKDTKIERISQSKFVYHVSLVRCQVPHVTCHASSVACHMSPFTCQLSLMPTSTATDPPLLALPLCKIGWLRPKNQKTCLTQKFIEMANYQNLQRCPNLSGTIFNQKSPVHQDTAFLNVFRQTHRQTDRHCQLWTDPGNSSILPLEKIKKRRRTNMKTQMC